MIQHYHSSQLEEIMEIWLDTNLAAHDFIPEAYWREHFSFVKSLLPEAELWVYLEQSVVKGFAGIMNQSYLAGLFVRKEYQSQGVGSALLEHLKRQYLRLELDVYVKNQSAVLFYKKHGFQTAEEKRNSDTQQLEYTMIWDTHVNCLSTTETKIN